MAPRFGWTLIILMLGYFPSLAQNSHKVPRLGSDSLGRKMNALAEVVVRGYDFNGKLLNQSAATSYISQAELNRFNPVSIVSALNAIPGVRMEERSPGSYRLNFRGSSIRSPFGVRNVKIYYDGIPFTDPSGNTYLNQLNFYNFHSIEILKDPSSSMYGSGTGGVMLIQSLSFHDPNQVNLNFSAGSYHLQNENIADTWGDSSSRNSINFSNLYSNGYRQQSALHRQVFSYDAILKNNWKDSLAIHSYYGDLFYQTPGGLTQAQFQADPKQARPPAGRLPGAVQTKAAISQKTFFAGAVNQFQFNSQIKNTTAIYGTFSQFVSPTLFNFKRRMEPHFGGRTVFQYRLPFVDHPAYLEWGAEGQDGFFNAKVYHNHLGSQDSLITDDNIHIWQYFIFAQAVMEIQSGWSISAGVSWNKTGVGFTRLTVFPVTTQSRNYGSILAPRIAISKSLSPEISIYGNISQGFSPPSTEELLPSTTLNLQLNAEQGINEEVGSRGSLLSGRLYYDFAAFLFTTHQDIVESRDSSGTYYYSNRGTTRKMGTETYLSYQLFRSGLTLLKSARLWVSHTFDHFNYLQYSVLGKNYSGNPLPSVPVQSLDMGLDVSLHPGWYAHITYSYTGKIPLNDGNTAFAPAFSLLSARVGWGKTMGKTFGIEIYGGADNIFNVSYSLGDDINDAGGRYFNAAPGRNFYAGISLQLP
ncbi:MAG: TonB-dependent receptor family protein [Chitinophagaceae bacterium]